MNFYVNMANLCTLLIIAGILFLISGVGFSVRFRVASFIIPGGLGTMMIALGLILKIIGHC